VIEGEDRREGRNRIIYLVLEEEKKNPVPV
jgi:hypothetical protein